MHKGKCDEVLRKMLWEVRGRDEVLPEVLREPIGGRLPGRPAGNMCHCLQCLRKTIKKIVGNHSEFIRTGLELRKPDLTGAGCDI